MTIYTDGITEARKSDGTNELFGTDRLDDVVCSCAANAQEVVDRVVKAVNQFSDYAPATDDRTLVVAQFS